MLGLKECATTAWLVGKLREQKTCSPRSKAVDITQIQEADYTEKARQALAQKRHYLCDIRRTNSALAWEVTYWGQLHRTCKEDTSRLNYHIPARGMMCCKGQEHNRLGGEVCGAERLSARQEGRQLQGHCGSNAALKEGSSSASYVSATISTETR